MQGHPNWCSTIVVTCSLAAVVAVVMWTLRKNSEKRRQSAASLTAQPNTAEENADSGEVGDREEENSEKEVTHDDHDAEKTSDEVSELSNLNWKKVGQIQELYMYPLKSGRGKSLKNCDFTEFGISFKSEGRFPLRDRPKVPVPKESKMNSWLFIRMFLVYNEETGRFQTSRQYPTLILVSLTTVDESKVKLEAVGMPSVIFEVPKCSENATEAVQCTMWWGEHVNCIDCGQEPAEWLSRFLTGTNSGLRLGCTKLDKRNVFTEPWKKFTYVYQKLRNEDTGLFSDLASYMLMTTRSVEQLNEKLERPVPTLQFRPNILVSTQNPFEEDNWEWIKIGEKVVIRNIKPCARCKMVRINPENGVMDKEEPLETLKTFRAQTDPDRVLLEGNAPTMGIYCGLYIPGQVKIGDDVFVNLSNESPAESSDREAVS